MTKAKVLKSLSELSQIEQRIELAAYALYQVVFKGSSNEDFAPKQGTQLHRAFKMHKLDERQLIAWQALFDDLRLAAGKSGGTTGSSGEVTDNGRGDTFKIPTARVNIHYRRVEALWGALSRRERALLRDIIQDVLRGDGGFTLEMVGLLRSGYGEKVSARAAGVAHVQNLLDRIATVYGV